MAAVEGVTDEELAAAQVLPLGLCALHPGWVAWIVIQAMLCDCKKWAAEPKLCQ